MSRFFFSLRRLAVVSLIICVGGYFVYLGIEYKGKQKIIFKRSLKATVDSPYVKFTLPSDDTNFYTITTPKGIKSFAINGQQYMLPPASFSFKSYSFSARNIKQITVEPVLTGMIYERAKVKIKEGVHSDNRLVLVPSGVWGNAGDVLKGQIVRFFLPQGGYSYKCRNSSGGRQLSLNITPSARGYFRKTRPSAIHEFPVVRDGQLQVKTGATPFFLIGSILKDEQLDVYNTNHFLDMTKLYSTDDGILKVDSLPTIILKKGESRKTPFWVDCGDTINFAYEKSGWVARGHQKQEHPVSTHRGSLRFLFSRDSCSGYVTINAIKDVYINRVHIHRKSDYSRSLGDGATYVVKLAKGDTVAFWSRGDFYANGIIKDHKTYHRYSATNGSWDITLQGMPSTGEVWINPVKKRGY